MSSSSDEAEFDSDEDMPLAGLKNLNEVTSPSKKRRASSSKVNYAEEEDDDDEEEEEEDEEDDDEDDDDDSSEDEDMPLSALKGESPKKKKKPAPKKKQPAKKKAKAKTTKKSTPKASSSSSSTKYSSASAAFYGSKCAKGLLIQRLLCRWWYAINWPDTSKIPESPPKNCDALDGFPGVYICTAGDDVGKIIDYRNKDDAPSFENLAKKSSEELQELLIKALDEQKRQLIDAEGTGNETEKELNNLLKWAKKVKAKTADKDGEKVLKKLKLTK